MAELEAAIIGEFLADSQELIESLGLGLKGGDALATFKAAHSLHGICLTIGASALASTAAAIVEAMRSGDLARLPTLADRALLQHKQLGMMLRTRLAGRG